MAVAMVDAVAVTRGERGREQVNSSACFLCPTPPTNTSSVYFISLKVGGGRGSQALTLTQTRRPQQDGYESAPRPAGPRRETRERARDGRPITATDTDVFPLPGPVCLDEITIRSQRKRPRRPLPLRTSPRRQLRGCRRRCHERERLALLIVCYMYHDAILMLFSTRLFPSLPSNAAAEGAWFARVGCGR